MITRKDLKNFSRYRTPNISNRNGKLFLSQDQQFLLKLCKNTSYEYLEFFKNLNITNQITFPIEVHQTNLFRIRSAYLMKFYQDAHILSYAYHLPSDEKKQIILEFFSILKQLHEYIVVGDIHLHNLMVYQGHALFCDWDSFRKIEDDQEMIRSRYYIYNGSCDQNQFTDMVKMVVSALCFYFGEGMEVFLEDMQDNNLFYVLHTVMEVYPELTDCLNLLLEEFWQMADVSKLDPTEFVNHLPEVDPGISLSLRISNKIFH